MAFGNSGGDFPMLQWTTTGKGPRSGRIVHHTDAQREWAHDWDSPVGRLDRALDAAPKEGWVVVDMKKDGKVIYPFEKKEARPGPQGWPLFMMFTVEEGRESEKDLKKCS
jgi:hypothetical protein